MPLIRHTFKHGYLTFAIIEPLQIVPVEEDVFVQKVADAVLWMRSQACPAGVALGPLGSGPAWRSQVLFGNLVNVVVRLDFGGEDLGVTKFYNVVGEMDEASVTKHFAIVVLMVGAGDYNGWLKRDKRIVQRHGSKKAK